MAIHAIVTSESFNTQPREGGCLEQAKAQVDGVQFQHTAARRRLPKGKKRKMTKKAFQHTAARRRLLVRRPHLPCHFWFQHTAARRRLLAIFRGVFFNFLVSTHSRAKAAACFQRFQRLIHPSFNTQPREGGCVYDAQSTIDDALFQHTAARRRLRTQPALKSINPKFQHTAARRRLQNKISLRNHYQKFQHTAARRRLQ